MNTLHRVCSIYVPLHTFYSKFQMKMVSSLRWQQLTTAVLSTLIQPLGPTQELKKDVVKLRLTISFSCPFKVALRTMQFSGTYNFEVIRGDPPLFPTS